jgi:methylase of polypeptide subunit release factors
MSQKIHPTIAPIDCSLGDIPLDTSAVPQSLLNIENKDRSNLFPWNGQFSPQFVEALMNVYAAPDATVLDPFAGSGTVLHEAGRKQLRAVAAEINPAAYAMAGFYKLINLDLRQRSRVVSYLDEKLDHAFPERLPLFFSMEEQTEDEIKYALTGLALEQDDPFAELLLDALIILLDFYQAGLRRERLITVWNRLKVLALSLPHSENRLEVYNCDARALPLADETVDLIITSPPYINVFNYHQQYRASAEALGWDMLTVAKSEIGSNRKHRGNRFLTVIQYCLDLAQVLTRLFKAMKPDGRAIFVVGRESRVRGIPFFNGEIVSRLGTQCVGFELKTRQERVFRNRFGEMIYEDILHFTRLAKLTSDPLSKARDTAGEILDEAMRKASREVAKDIASAREQLFVIEPSPIYRAETAYKNDGQKLRKEYRSGAGLSHSTS